MSDPQRQTPRTDEVARTEVKRGLNNQFEVQIVPADFARQLERELAEAKEQRITTVAALCNECDAKIAALEQRLAEAEQRAAKWDKVDALAFVLTAKLAMLNTLDLSGREVLLRSDVMDLVYRWRTDHDAALKERHE